MDDADIPGLPSELLSQHPGDNCLPRLRAHFRDLHAGAERVTDIKLMLLGNGRVGKTQIARRLRGEAFEPEAESTHGAVVTSADLPAPNDEGEPTRLQLWDFGGQDIYLGTHALFLQSRAVFLLAWTPEMEDAGEHEYGGHTFRNYPLDYWLHYVAHMAGTATAVLVVQSQCDAPGDQRPVPPAEPHRIADFAFAKSALQHSARTDRGHAALREALQEAVQWLHDNHGIAEIGAGRAQVKRELEAMREAAQKAPASADAARWITRDQFADICERARNEAGPISNEDALLDFLHRTGTVFWRPELFHGRIVVDQAWALEAIYAIFHRDSGALRRIRDRQHGRFTPSDLAESLWDKHGYDREAQALFLSMMESAGICFQLIPAPPGDVGEAEYLAPDLLPLPEQLTLELAQKWDDDATPQEARFRFDFLPPSLLRHLMARFGRDAGLAGDYWHDGFYLYDTRTGARAIVDQIANNDFDRPWGGELRIRTQKGDPATLLDRLCSTVEWECGRIGLTAPSPEHTTRGRIRQTLPRVGQTASGTVSDEHARDVRAGYEPPAQREHFASYAHSDDETREGRLRKAAINALFETAEARGIKIRTDVEEVAYRDSIETFMDRMAKAPRHGERVYIVLSDKYLKSSWCMYELYYIWVNSRQDFSTFWDHVDVVCLPDVNVTDPKARLRIAKYWKDRFKELDDMASDDPILLGEETFKEYRRMKYFALCVDDILSQIARHLHVRHIDDMDKLHFDP